MDPNACLVESLELAQRIVDAESDEDIRVSDAGRLAELVLAMDGWLSGSRAGFLPEGWKSARSKHANRARNRARAQRALDAKASRT
jgi:hypothetical protein